jgi:hypothetical protein
MANKYMYLYLGGVAPPASEAEGKWKWMEYFGKLGPPWSMAERPSRRNRNSSARARQAIREAIRSVALTAGHPHLANAGGIEVLELAKVPGV